MPACCSTAPTWSSAWGSSGAGFSDACQAVFQADLRREYGDQVEPFDYRRIAADELASASGAVSFRKLHFGRDFWRFRLDSLTDAPSPAYVTARPRRRPGGRTRVLPRRTLRAGRAGPVPGRPAPRWRGPSAQPPAAPHRRRRGPALARRHRAAPGRRAAPAGRDGRAGDPLRGGAGRLGGDGRSRGGGAGRGRGADPRRCSPSTPGGVTGARSRTPVAECLVFYSPEADLWSSGLHRLEVEEVGEALSRLHVQWDVATGGSPLRPGAVLVLPQATGDHAGRGHRGDPVPRGRRPGARPRRGPGSGPGRTPPRARSSPRPRWARPRPPAPERGRCVALASARPASVGRARSPGVPSSEPLERGLAALLGRGRRAVQVYSPRRSRSRPGAPPKRLDVHVSALSDGVVRGRHAGALDGRGRVGAPGPLPRRRGDRREAGARPVGWRGRRGAARSSRATACSRWFPDPARRPDP